MKKTIAYLLIIIGLVNFVLISEIVEKEAKKFKIVDQMYASEKGVKAIVSRLELKICGNELKIFSGVLMLLLFGAGAVILFLVRIQKVEARLKKLEEGQK